MKLLYATSISYPSKLANRIQVAAMAQAYSAELESNFTLGLFADKGLPDTVKTYCVESSSRSFILAWTYLRLIRSQQFTHVIIREERLLFFLGLYARLTRTPVVLILESHWIRPGLRYRIALFWAHMYICISEGLRTDLLRRYGIPASKSMVAHDAVDTTKFAAPIDRQTVRAQYGFAPDKKIILYTGSFGHHHPWKGVDTLAESAEFSKSDWEYVFVGGRTDEIELLKEIYPSNQIQFREHVPNGEVAALLRAADVLVIPNKSGNELSERHTSPLKLFEYMASGIPIVASDLPSIREALHEGEGTFFEPNSPKQLAEALSAVFNTYDERLEAAAKVQKRMASFDWNARARTILAFIAGQS